MSRTTTVRLTEARRKKLLQLAGALGSNQSATIGQLIDNAAIVPITRHEAVATLPAKTNRHDAQNLTGSSVTAVSA